MARTVTSTVRVVDVLRPVLRDDPRVDVVFAYDPTSAFNDGVYDLLRALGARVMPWDQLPHAKPDLIVTATENADLTDRGGDAPVLVLPHGVGFHKVVPDSRGPFDRLAGVVPDALLHSGRAWLAISHPDQADQLRAAHPAAAGRTVLVGDPCYDALLEGRKLRARYRAALGVPDGRRLVMLSSTWREQSVIGGDASLPARLLAELPRDEYAVALVTHPNVIAAHGLLQLENVLGSALSSGLLRIPPDAGWQATLLACDLLIGDHGSVSFYGAALGTPLLLGAFGEHEVVPGTPMRELGRLAPHLDPYAPLRPQLERALDRHDADRFRKLGERALAVPGQALGRLRETVYDLLELPAPTSPSVRRLAPADPRPAAVDAVDAVDAENRASVILTRTDGEPGAERVSVERYPAAVGHLIDEPVDALSAFRHLSSPDDAHAQETAESASVLVRSAQARTAVEAARWIGDTLARYSGALLAATTVAGGGCRVGLVDGRTVEVSATGPVTDPEVLAAVVYACLRAGIDVTPSPWTCLTLVFAGREEDVVVRPLPTHSTPDQSLRRTSSARGLPPSS
ncbi:CDP-glycerol glycerophosphotransferase family protein [Streptomyces sp. E11-3]|uniref:CDP-glycerol glycerophosphotransferase family protein n=1 Tax=Streptomyces sp. E11-3 TaxID=3110112 RepID=UPI00397E95AC